MTVNKKTKRWLLTALLYIFLIPFAACGVLEVNIEHTNTPTKNSTLPPSVPSAVPTTSPPTSWPIPTFTSSPIPLPSTATPTPVPPTLTATPPLLTPILTPAPAVERILFTPGTTQTLVEGYLPANGTQVYVIGMAADQFVEMSAAVGTMGQGLRFSIVGADGTVVKTMGEAHVRTVVPRTQDYYVELDLDFINLSTFSG